MTKKDKLVPSMRKSSREDPAISRERQTRVIGAWADGQKDVELAEGIWEGGVSGSKRWQDRGLGQAIQACRDGLADGIVVEDISRLSRANGKATAEVWDAFEEGGFRLVAVADGIDTAKGDHELNFAMRAALAREQWKQYRRRVQDAKRNAVARGVHISAKVPVGYVRPGRGRKLEVDPKTAPAIRRAFALRATGAGRPTVAALLEELLPGGPQGRGRWTPETVGTILRNRVYIGEARAGEYVNPSGHEAIVDRDVFDTVQALWTRVEHRKAPPSTVALLGGGLVRCASCGYSLTRSADARPVYKCRGHSSTGTCSARASIAAGALDEYVEAAARERVRSLRIERVPATVDVDGLHAKLAKLREQRSLFEDGEYAAALGREAALRGLQGVDEKILVVERELADSVGAVDATERRFFEAAEVWPEDVAGRRAVIAAGVDGVIVSRSPGRGTPIGDRVDIRWRGEGTPIPRPSPGRRTKVEAGVAPAKLDA